MANVPISSLPAAGALTGIEVAPIVQGGNTVKATVQAIADLAGGAVANVVQRFALIAADTSIDPSHAFTLINSAAVIDDGDSLNLFVLGALEEDTAPAATIRIQLRVNGTVVVQSFFAVGGNNCAYTVQAQITRNGANLDVAGNVFIGQNIASTGNPTAGTHINVGAGSMVYAGNLDVALEFDWTSSIDPLVDIYSGYAQIMRAA